MNQLTALETMAVTMVLGILQLVIKNPSKQAAVQAQLIGLANDIYGVYGIAVPLNSLQTAPIASGGGILSALETMGLTMMIGVLQLVIKDPTKAASLKQQFIGVANDIYLTYGIALPPTATETALGLTRSVRVPLK
jgi:hypothetical protein